MKKISQREARRLQGELARLVRQQRERDFAFAQDYPGGVHILTFGFGAYSQATTTLKTVRRLGHTIVATIPDAEGYVKFFAVKPA